MKNRLLVVVALVVAAATTRAEDVWTDITARLINNADLASGTAGWTIEGEGWTPDKSTDGHNTHIVEQFAGWAANTNRLPSDKPFAIRQSLTLPAGTYRLEAYATYRSGGTTSSAAISMGGSSVTVPYRALMPGTGNGNDRQKVANTFQGTTELYTLTFTLAEAGEVTLRAGGTHTCYKDWFVLGPVRLYVQGARFAYTKGGTQHYLGAWAAADITACLTDEAPVIDLTEATLTGTLNVPSTNPNGIVYAPAGASITGGNVVTGGTCARFTLTDGHPVVVPTAFTATAASYNMTALAGGRFGTLLLPYAAQLPAGATAYALDTDLDLVTGQLRGTPLTALTANAPALVTATGQYTGSGVQVAATAQTTYTHGHLTGLYAPQAAPEGSYVLQAHTSGTAFYLVGPTRPTVPALRAYIPAAGSNVKAISVVLDGATGIMQPAECKMQNDAVYDLQGRRVAHARRGIYIVNGKKIVR